MKTNVLYKITLESLQPCAFLTIAFFIFQPFGNAYDTLMEYFFHIVLCEVLACFIGCFLSLLVSYHAFGYHFDTKETIWGQTKKLVGVYLLCIPLTAFLLYVVNHLFLPLEINLTVPGYPEFWPSFAFYCSIVFRYCIVFFVIDVFVYRHRKMKHEFDEICAINEMLKSYQEDLAFTSAVESEKKGDSISVKVGQNSNQELVFNPESLIYVESVGNYANVCYIDDELLTNTTIRTTIKQLKEDLSGNDFIVQCHRGFLVNLEYVESMEGSNGRFFLNMFCSEKKIPVSRVNKSTIKDTLAALRSK